jgi:hypothetical protein
MENIRRLTKMRRDLGKLVELMKKNGDKELIFVGMFFVNKTVGNLWFGSKTGKLYVEFRESSFDASRIAVSDFFKTLVSFEELKNRLKEGDEKLKEAIRSEFGISLIELILEENDNELELVDYFKPLKLRVWRLARKAVYVETLTGAYKEDDPKELYEALRRLKNEKEKRFKTIGAINS